MKNRLAMNLQHGAAVAAARGPSATAVASGRDAPPPWRLGALLQRASAPISALLRRGASSRHQRRLRAALGQLDSRTQSDLGLEGSGAMPALRFAGCALDDLYRSRYGC